MPKNLRPIFEPTNININPTNAIVACWGIVGKSKICDIRRINTPIQNRIINKSIVL